VRARSTMSYPRTEDIFTRRAARGVIQRRLSSILYSCVGQSVARFAARRCHC
jgi:hypothetical protein